MRRFLFWVAVLVAMGLATAFLLHAHSPWAAGLAAAVFALSLIFYHAATRPGRRARRALGWMDEMDGVEFEQYVAGLLRMRGYKNVQTTAATGDYGADLVAEHGGLTYIFQCKRYGKNCGVSAVQEICGAKAHYSSDVEVVVTNLYFTKNATVLAEETGVELWDRDVLAGLVTAGKRAGR